MTTANLQCSHCREIIHDRYYMRIGNDECRHEKCARCIACQQSLVSACYLKGHKMYCKQDYFRLFSPHRCFVCCSGIAPCDQVYKVTMGIYCHAHCHRCSLCEEQLKTGETMALDRRYQRLYCTKHTNPDEIVRANATIKQEQDQSEPPNEQRPSDQSVPKNEISHEGTTSIGDRKDEVKDGMTKSPAIGETEVQSDNVPMEQAKQANVAEDKILSGLLKRRGPRTTIKPFQLQMLNDAFTKTPKPTKHVRAKLALDTGLTMRVIQVRILRCCYSVTKRT
ncbi:MEC 3 [Trichuris trichiura]|uniref:MEC 3 n=1 Tax=Trichuris trichiura TaxID=36087 RepID=A0A077ZH44_TRITR|nr:MEC 3 [Trichuris trichiura]